MECSTKDVRVAAALAIGAALGGCSTITAPVFRVDGVAVTEETAEASVLTFRVVGENRNPDPLPMSEVRYTLWLDGRQVFSGSRSPEATLTRFGTQRIDLPVALANETWSVPDAEGLVTYTLRGEVEYLTPGTIAEVLFDNDIRRPTAPFEQSGRLDFSALKSDVIMGPAAP